MCCEWTVRSCAMIVYEVGAIEVRAGDLFAFHKCQVQRPIILCFEDKLRGTPMDDIVDGIRVDPCFVANVD